MKKILITGASGFLAAHIIRECHRRGWFTIGVDKRPFRHVDTEPPHQFLQADVNDLKFRDLMGIDYIFHGAWRTNIPDCARHPEDSTRDNIDMSMHLLEVAKEAGVKKFLFPSTASLYGNNPTPWTEEMTPDPIEPYSWQKLSIEYACKMYAKNGLPTEIFRFFQVFGEYQRDDTALAAFMRFKANGQPVTLTETVAQSSFRSGQRDFIYAGDLAEAVCLVAEKGEGKGEIYNVATGKCHTMEEIAQALEAEVKWIPRRPYEVERHEGDISKLKALGWEPKTEVTQWLRNR